MQGVDAGELKSAFDEAKGDFYQQQGNAGAAYTAYEAAMMGIDAGNSSREPAVATEDQSSKPVAANAVEAEESVEQDDAS